MHPDHVSKSVAVSKYFLFPCHVPPLHAWLFLYNWSSRLSEPRVYSSRSWRFWDNSFGNINVNCNKTSLILYIDLSLNNLRITSSWEGFNKISSNYPERRNKKVIHRVGVASW
jgi:hypothetical protein